MLYFLLLGCFPTEDSSTTPNRPDTPTPVDTSDTASNRCFQPQTPEELARMLPGVWEGTAFSSDHMMVVSLSFNSDGSMLYTKPSVYSPDTCSEDEGGTTPGTWRAMGPTLLMVSKDISGEGCGDGRRTGISDIYITADCIMTGETDSSQLWGNTYYTIFELEKVK